MGFEHASRGEPLPACIFPAPTHLLVRSTGESFPKKGDFSSLLLSCLHRCQAGEHGSAGEIYLFTPGFSHAEMLIPHFPDSVFLTLPLSAPHLFPLLASGIADRIILAVHSISEPVINPALSELSMIFGSLQPQNRAMLVQELWSRGARESLESLTGPYTRDSIILPEKTGKLRLWSMASGYRDRVTKKYRHYRYDAVPVSDFKRGPLLDAVMPAEAGAGLSCTLFLRGDSAKKLPGHRLIWSVEFDLGHKGISLLAPGEFSAALFTWLFSLPEGRDRGESLAEKVYISLPCWSLSFVFREHLISEWPEGSRLPAFLFPDLMLGWGPELSFLQFLTDPEKNLLFLDFSSFPSIRCFYSEKGAGLES